MWKLYPRTWWNNLLKVSEQFLKIKSSVSNAMIDCNTEMNILNREFAVVNNLNSTTTSEKLGQRGTVFLVLRVFSFILNKLNEKNSSFQ